MTPAGGEQVRKRLAHSRQYFENGREALEKEEASKAGELFWGGVAQALYALAAVRGANVETHRDLKNFARRIADELDAGHNLWANFLAVEILHKGFYDINVELTDIQQSVPIARQAIESVSSLLPPEWDNQT